MLGIMKKAYFATLVLLRIYVIVITGQEVDGVKVPPAVRVLRGTAIGDSNDQMLLHEHCVQGSRFYILSFGRIRRE